MQITVQLPDDLVQHENPGRAALEALVIEGFSSGALTSHEARLLLGMDNRFEFDGFLKERGVEAGSYGFAEHEQDQRSLAKLHEDRQKKRSA